jgi:hypothetical protein
MLIKLDPTAKSDMLKAIEHKENSPRTDVAKFIHCMDETVKSLSFMPLRHPKVPTRDYRYIIDKTYEYKLCYYVEDEYVRILYVIHPKENRY